ncbi:hypothetical protein FB451DRAFT_1565052 [Mycena latifolia]|nr:hypothetical protein FB451DRAFT_1565052 [Mycena latifolia]
MENDGALGRLVALLAGFSVRRTSPSLTGATAASPPPPLHPRPHRAPRLHHRSQRHPAPWVYFADRRFGRHHFAWAAADECSCVAVELTR